VARTARAQRGHVHLFFSSSVSLAVKARSARSTLVMPPPTSRLRSRMHSKLFESKPQAGQ